MFAIVNWPRFVVFLVALIVAAGLVAGGVLVSGGRVVKDGEIVVVSGEGALRVWNKMAAGGLIRRTLPWRYAAWRAGAASALKTGTYRVQAGERPGAVIARIRAGEVVPELAITYPEGFTLKQMAARTEARGIGTAAAFADTAQPQMFVNDFSFLKDLPAGRTLEGYLFPDTYQVFPDDGPPDVIRRMLANFEQKFSDDLRQELPRTHRTLDQVVIMASIIEREVTGDADMAKVAGVLWKRADSGAGLDADATIRFALEKWDGALTADDLRVDSPYNTRRYRGLPPGPISNPGWRALAASVRPEASDYYYYLSTPDGRTVFAKTNEEHNANKAKYLR